MISFCSTLSARDDLNRFLLRKKSLVESTRLSAKEKRLKSDEDKNLLSSANGGIVNFALGRFEMRSLSQSEPTFDTNGFLRLSQNLPFPFFASQRPRLR